MKIYNYKNGEKAVFIDNQKINITDFESEVIEKFYSDINRKASKSSYIDDPKAVLEYIRSGKVQKQSKDGITLWVIEGEQYCIENGENYVFASETRNFDEWVNMYFPKDSNEDSKETLSEEEAVKSGYVYSEDKCILYNTSSEFWPSCPEKCAYLIEKGKIIYLELENDSSSDNSISYYQGEKGALVVEKDNDGTENPLKSGWYLSENFEDYQENYM